MSVHSLKSYFHSLGGKVFGTAMISVLLFLALLIGFILPRVHTLLLDSKKDGLRHVVESIHSQMEFLAGEAKAGHLTQDEAQSRAKAMAEAIRFDGENYVFIHGPGSVMLVLPLARKMEGKGPGELPPAMLSVVKGLDGVAEAAPGGAFWDYAFGKPGKEGLFPKSAYVMRINDWGWIIGAGVYLDDIDSQMRGMTLSLLGGALLVAILVAGIAQSRSRRMVRPLHQLVQGLRESDLSRRIEVASLDEIGQAADAFNEYNGKMRSMLVTLGGYAERVASGATELAATTEQLSATTAEISAGAEQQRVATTQASTTLRKVSASIVAVSERVERANGLSKGSLEMAAGGMASARACTQNMGAIQESSSKVARITHVIADIARQTNLLSLNAAIEAAKAGNQGKGFAVVADEIRKLADRSAGAAKEIADLIQVSSDRVAEGVASAEGVGSSLASIEANIRERAEGVVIIAAAMKEDAVASRELADTVGFVAEQTERSASATHELSSTILEIARTTEELSEMANQLRSLTVQFNI